MGTIKLTIISIVFTIEPLRSIAFAISKELAVHDFNTYVTLNTMDKNEKIYSLAWVSQDQPLVALEFALEDPGDTRVRLWDVAVRTPLVEFQGGER